MTNTILSGVLTVAAVFAAGVGPLSAQQEVKLTLQEARELARERSPLARTARLRAVAAGEAGRAAAASRWPVVGLEAGAVHSNDPVAAFGGRLRQGRFTQPDFELDALNHPDPLTDWSAAAGLTWTPVDLAREARVAAAGAQAAASRSGAEWAGREAEYGAVVRYLEAVAADERLATATSALEAAEANLAVTRRRMEEGVLTQADVLRSRAAAEGSRARRIDAERAVADARDALASALGLGGGVVPVPDGATLEEVPPIPSGGVVDGRADLVASEYAVRGAQALVNQSRRARLPTVEGFARVETHALTAFGAPEDDWMLGFRLRVPLFTGFALSAREQRARANHEAARIGHEDRVTRAERARDGALRATTSARSSLVAAEAGAEAATEAVRLVRRRFEEGMATVADLLAAEAAAVETASAETDARLAVRAAVARVELMTGEAHPSDTSDARGGRPGSMDPGADPDGRADRDTTHGYTQGWNR